MHKFTFGMIALVLVALQGTAYAKLPAPSDEAIAAAAEAKDKAAWTDKIAAYQLCMAQDKVAAYYFKTKSGSKKPATEIPACANPGPYVAAVKSTQQVGVADAKPVPAAGKPEPAAPAKK